MLTHVHIKNFRSFVDAQTTLRPFTLILGANGSGKSNFLKFFQVTSQEWRELAIGGVGMREVIAIQDWTRHIAHSSADCGAILRFGDDRRVVMDTLRDSGGSHWITLSSKLPWGSRKIAIFNPSPDKIAAPEKPAARPVVNGDGGGTCQVLDALKTGDREDLFDKIEDAFKTYVPEVEKLSLLTLGDSKQIQVRERGLKRPLPATELSEGTRLILCLLTILYQERPPPLLLLEDIDRGLHPRLFEYMAPLIRRMAEEHDINIIATTHNPYLVNYFRDDKDAVVLVEKVEGQSKLIPLPQRVAELNDKEGDADEVPLGELWFSGLLGGTPKTINPSISK